MPEAKSAGSNIAVNLPFLSLESNWEVDETQRNAAWELYVELVTRVTVQKLKEDEGLVREALSSFYSLFQTTREVLKKYGPSVAIPAKPGETTLSHIAVGVLNGVLRPFLVTWHPILKEYEDQKPAGMSVAAY